MPFSVGLPAMQMVGDPLMVPQIVGRVGLPAMGDWLLHLAGLAFYSFLDWDLKVGVLRRV